MEEYIGGIWHRFITRAADRRFQHAAVRLADIEKTAGILFRAFGGDAGLKVAHAADTAHGSRRSLLHRIAGSGEKSAHAAVDGETLRLPPEIALFPDKQHNRDLYLWLIALAAQSCNNPSPALPNPSPALPNPSPALPLSGEGAFASPDKGGQGGDDFPPPDKGGQGGDDFPPPDKGGQGGVTGGQGGVNAWLQTNQQSTLAVLARYPGLASRYARLVEAVIAQRMPLAKLPAAEAAREIALRLALTKPGSVNALPPVPPKARALQPVPLWLYPSPAEAAKAAAAANKDGEDNPEGGGKEETGTKKRYAAERADTPESKSGMLLAFRAESLLSWGEYVKVDRHTDEDENPDAAEAAEDMEFLAIARDGKSVASKVRFDLDLPSAAEDDTPLGKGIPLPEWDWKKRQLKPDYCRLQLLKARNASPTEVPERLRRSVKRLRSQFAALQPTRRWLKNQADGAELDVDACVRLAADRSAGVQGVDGGAYQAQVRQERDMACLVLADLSLSTDAHANDQQKVIAVIRDSLMLFAEALNATGDRFGLYGFSSLRRGNVRFHEIKSFDGGFDAEARGRIAALKPGYYTRMGAAIRHATGLLQKQPAALRVLLILSDGKPNDLDQYEGRYGIEDTRMAVLAAHKAGLKPFCVTIDREGAAYLPHLFGPAGYTIIRKPEELPARLPLLYAQLTGR